MKIMKKNGQKYPNNLYRAGGEYEIKTFTANQRNRSPIEFPQNITQNIRRSPNRIYEQGTSESALGEMIYLEPNEINYRIGQNMSPLNDSRNMIMRSPNEINRNEIKENETQELANSLRGSIDKSMDISINNSIKRSINQSYNQSIMASLITSTNDEGVGIIRKLKAAFEQSINQEI